jgi:hypothetical protein
MKTIRSLTILAGLSVMLFALGATGAKAESGPSLSITNFAGTFTLPFEAQWGNMTLPAGDYSLYYGEPLGNGFYMVEVVGHAKGSPHGRISVAVNGRASVAKDSLICIREGNSLVVQRLEMPELGKSVTFAMPHGTQLVAHNGRRNGYTQLAEAPMLIQRIPIAMNAR